MAAWVANPVPMANAVDSQPGEGPLHSVPLNLARLALFMQRTEPALVGERVRRSLIHMDRFAFSFPRENRATLGLYISGVPRANRGIRGIGANYVAFRQPPNLTPFDRPARPFHRPETKTRHDNQPQFRLLYCLISTHSVHRTQHLPHLST